MCSLLRLNLAFNILFEIILRYLQTFITKDYMAKQNVLLVNLHPLSSRNFFTSNVVEKLSKDPDRHFYILVPDYKRAFF